MSTSGNDSGIGKDIRHYMDQRREMLAFLPQNCRTLLDVGCASAAIGALMKSELGDEVLGVEPVPEIAAIVARNIDSLVVSIEGIVPNEDYAGIAKMFVLSRILGKWMEDIPYQQFGAVPRPKA
jgi:hypothetical protein